VNFQCTTAAFTLSPAPVGFRHLVLTHPGTRPSMRFLSVGSHLCAQASSRHPLAGLPLPSASSYYPRRGHRYSYRGLSPHQFTPMPGVHKTLQPMLVPRTAERVVLAPRKARRLLPGESPGRVRASHPPVSSLGPDAERRKPRTRCRASVDRESCRPQGRSRSLKCWYSLEKASGGWRQS